MPLYIVATDVRDEAADEPIPNSNIGGTIVGVEEAANPEDAVLATVKMALDDDFVELLDEEMDAHPRKKLRVFKSVHQYTVPSLEEGIIVYEVSKTYDEDELLWANL